MKIFSIKKKFIFAAAIFLAGLFVLNYLFSYVESRRPSAMNVRVRIAHKVNEVIVASGGRYKILGAEQEEKSGKTKISILKGELFVDGKKLKGFKVEIVPSEDTDITVRGISYRGNIRVMNDSGTLEVINVLGIEEYLKGVVPKEIYPFWPQAAIRAQAIAARSYAAYRVFQREKKSYDLRSSAASQVYGGKSAETIRTNLAVDETNGKVLEYEGKVFPAYFHACCGGHTESAEVLWGESLPPLAGVKCHWCRFSPYYNWKETFSPGKMLEKIKAISSKIKRVDDIRPEKIDHSGRVETLKIRSGQEWNIVKVSDIRREIGKDQIKSSKFKVTRYPFAYVFKGHGWGHGVGMCQWGAMGMAVMLKSTKTILMKYYPGTKIVDLRTLLK